MTQVVYLVYDNLGYDGIDVEGIATDMQSAMKIAVAAYGGKNRDIVIEIWPVDQFGRGWFKGADVKVKGGFVLGGKK